jgi:hemerythrin superfamily protein
VLAEDHRAILTLLEHMAQSPDGAVFARTQRLFRLKRRLAAHALAEEDVVYPLLHDRGAAAEARHLYEEHAEMKMHLYHLEQMPKDDPRWRPRVVELRTLIEGHIRQEEEVEFPKLRAALDDQAVTRLSAQMGREKALLL